MTLGVLQQAAAHFTKPFGAIELWAAERLAFDPAAEATSSALYEDYVAWCGTERLAYPHRGFGQHLVDAGIKRRRTATDRIYCGLALRAASPQK